MDPLEPELGPLVSGTSSYVDGTFVWTDYAYDDRGANTVDHPIFPRDWFIPPGAPERSGGDAVYPAFAADGNAADLIQLQIGVDSNRLRLRAILETLVAKDLPILGVAFDTDADPATGAAAMPGGQWPALDPLGIEILVVVTKKGGELWRADGEEWSRVEMTEGLVTGEVDRKANTIDVAVHARLLPPMTGTWRAFAVVGIRNPSGGSWLDGSEPIFDLAFVGDEPFVRWQDNRQSDILAGQLSSTHAAATLDFAKMSSGATELVDETAPGFKTFLFHSKLDLPEGINLPNPARLAQHEYLGPYQPYQVFIPEAIPEGNPLTVNLHGANTNHMLAIFDSSSGVYLGTSRVFSEDPFLIGIFVPDFGINQVLPATTEINVFGRGETLGYQGISEIDVLEARADAMQRLGTDPDRVTLRGSSMGGVGAYRLGTFYPDLWAATMPHIGTGISYRHIFGNLRNVPVRQVNGFFDNGELGPPSEDDAITLDGLDYDHHYWLMLDRGHDGPSYILCVWAQAADFVRNPNPAQVVYKVDPAFFQFDPSRDVDIIYDSAYWVSGIELADEVTLGSVDAMSQALPHSMETIVTNTVVRDNMTSGQDLCGPNPNFAPGWTPAFPAGESWLERSLVRVPGAPLPLLNSLSLDVENVAAVAIDLVRAGFAPGEAGTVEVASGGPVDVTLTGLSRKAAISVDGLPIGAAGKEGTVTVALPAGPHEIGIAAQ